MRNCPLPVKRPLVSSAGPSDHRFQEIRGQLFDPAFSKQAVLPDDISTPLLSWHCSSFLRECDPQAFSTLLSVGSQIPSLQRTVPALDCSPPGRQIPTRSAARRFLFSSLFYPHAPSAFVLNASEFSHAAKIFEFMDKDDSRLLIHAINLSAFAAIFIAWNQLVGGGRRRLL